MNVFSKSPHSHRSTGRRTVVGSRRLGFTLVEMLIAVGLIVLMLTLFASVFQTASSSVERQRGIAENDQQARALTRLIRTDLDRRTFRNVVPFYPNESPALQQTNFANRRGYLYLSENDPANDKDNVLQFTVLTTIPIKGEVGEPFYGRTQQSPDSANGIPTLLNHPDRDDGRPGDGVTVSTAAEVTYFIRGRNLHRRVLPLREPLEAPTQMSNPNDPVDNNGEPLPAFDGSGPYPLWSQFDLSMHSSRGVAVFHGVNPSYGDFLSNTGNSLGLPNYRFGFREDGRPFEFIQDAVAGQPEYIGRFTAAETGFPGISDNFPGISAPGGSPDVQGFYYPQYGLDGPNSTSNRDANSPYYRTDLSLVDDVVDQFNVKSDLYSTTQQAQMAPFDRTGEDVVLKDVTAFIVEVWDEELSQFVRIGNNQTADVDGDGNPDGKFRTDDVENDNFTSPNSSRRNRFDTWHPFAMVPTVATQPLDSGNPERDARERGAAPITPLVITRDKIEQLEQGASAIDLSSLGYRNLMPWRPSTANPPNVTYQQGDVVFADDLWSDTNSNGVYDVQEGAVTDNDPDTVPIHGYATFFVCKQPGYAGFSPPTWKYRPGERTVENLPPGTPDPNDPTLLAQPAIWEAVENRLPIRALRITIRFVNEEHNVPRQVTMVVSLMN